ncbi:MAG: 2-amino-4-ketopentanoate thiolase [Spirochaetales bacterium]|nr:2-amino-4-ketopentanoate thiolase [Spirochaetales bacterium]
MSNGAKQGNVVRIHALLRSPEERSHQLPSDTQSVPLEMWTKGRLLNLQAQIGEEVSIETPTGRQLTGNLIEVSPSWKHGFGHHVPELDEIGLEMKTALLEARKNLLPYEKTPVSTEGHQ